MPKPSRTPSAPVATAPRLAPAASRLGTFALLALLLLVAFRLTMTEVVRETLNQRLAPVTGQADALTLPQPGLATTVGLTIATAGFAGVAAGVTRLRRRDYLLLALIAGIVGLAGVSTMQAANRVLAVAGACDLAMGLLASWTALVLCRHGDRQRLLLCVLLAVLAAWTAKGLYQHYVEIPDTIRDYEQTKEKLWRSNGWEPDSPAVKLFTARMLSREVTGFVTFSNVLAAGFLPLLCAAVGLIVAAVARLRSRSAKAAPADRPETGAPSPSLPLVAGLLAVLSALSSFTLFLTGSRGACVLGAASLGLIVAGFFLREFLRRHRRTLTLAGVGLAILAAAAVVGYGLARHGLPSRSLLFRWHYWTASVQIIRDHPLWGVGLHNFGDYYTQYKLPESPEDVKDPHSFFVRLASELGLPAAALVAALVGWLIYRGFAAARDESSSTRPQSPAVAVAVAAGFCLLWWVLRLVTDIPSGLAPADASAMLVYNGMLYLVYAGAAFGGWMLAWAVLSAIPPRSVRIILVMTLAGAVGMFVYDQINMALVTGPVAMLFWVVLGAAATDGADPAEHARPRAQSIVPIAIAALALGLAAFVWVPMLQTRFDWDPSVYERQAAIAQRDARPAEALAAMDEALRRDPRGVEVRRWKIATLRSLNQPVGREVEQVLAINRTDNRLWMEMGLLPSDLPAARRAEILRRALWLNDQLEPQEPRRFTAAQIDRISAALQGQP